MLRGPGVLRWLRWRRGPCPPHVLQRWQLAQVVLVLLQHLEVLGAVRLSGSRVRVRVRAGRGRVGAHRGRAAGARLLLAGSHGGAATCGGERCLPGGERRRTRSRELLGPGASRWGTTEQSWAGGGGPEVSRFWTQSPSPVRGPCSRSPAPAPAPGLALTPVPVPISGYRLRSPVPVLDSGPGPRLRPRSPTPILSLVPGPCP